MVFHYFSRGIIELNAAKKAFNLNWTYFENMREEHHTSPIQALPACVK